MAIVGQWAFGSFEERQQGGYPIRLLWDSVLPYSKPTGTEDRPPWWPSEWVYQGQFLPDGWQRNMAEPQGIAMNFPANRHLNAVTYAMLGSRQSSEAPYRFKDIEQYPGFAFRSDDNHWPFEEVGGSPAAVPALELLRWAIERFTRPGTKLVIQLPERDVINAITLEDDLTPFGMAWEPNPPDRIEGTRALRDFVFKVLVSSAVDPDGLDLLPRVIGWYILDEPDIQSRFLWARPVRLARLRAIVKKAEIEARIAMGIGFEEFALLSPEEQQEFLDNLLPQLNPCILTVTTPFILDRPLDDPDAPAPPDPRRPIDLKTRAYGDPGGKLDPDDPNGFVHPPRVWTGAADIYGFDWYPFKRTKIAIDSDYAHLTCTPPEPTAAHFTEVDPVRSIIGLRDLRIELNGQAAPGTITDETGPDRYLPVFAWHQVQGFPPNNDPSKAGELGEPGPTVPPSGFVGLPATCAPSTLAGRILRFPTVDEMRFYNWAALLEWAEGTPGFAQYGAADMRLKEDFSRVAAETEYFANLRFSYENLAPTQVPRSARAFGRENIELPLSRLPVGFLYFRYLMPPAHPLTDDPNIWLIMVNRDYATTTAYLHFNFRQDGVRQRLFEEVKFMELTGRRFVVNSGHFRPISVYSFILLPYSVNIFRVRNL